MKCPYCHAVHDSATPANRDNAELPTPGSFMFCMDCASVFIMADDGVTGRVPTPDENKVAESHPTIQRLSAAWASLFRPNLN